jgi:hypothetical protein
LDALEGPGLDLDVELEGVGGEVEGGVGEVDGGGVGELLYLGGLSRLIFIYIFLFISPFTFGLQ